MKTPGKNEDMSETTPHDMYDNMWLFKTIVEHGSDWTFWLDSDGTLKYVSPAFERITGFSLKALKNNSRLLVEVIHPDDRCKWETHLKHHFKDEEAYQAEYRIITKEGDTRWIRHECQPVYDENGHFSGRRGSNRDITEQKENKEKFKDQMRQTELLQHTVEKLSRAQSLNEVYDIAVQGIVELLKADRASILLFEEDGRVHFKAWRNLSPEYRQKVDGHCPWQADEIDAQPIYMSDVYKADLSRELQAIMRKEGIGALVFFPLSQPKGLLGKFMVYFNTPHEFTEQEKQLAQVIARDLAAVIARQQALEEIQRAERIYRSIFENALEGIYKSTPDGKFIAVNPALVKMFAYRDKEELLAIENIDQLYWDDNERQQLVKLANDEGFLKNVELKMKRSDGQPLWVLMNERAVKDKAGRILYYEGSLIDISERKQAEEALHQQLIFSQAINNLSQNIILEEERERLLESMVRIAGETLQLDRCLIYEVNFKKREAHGLCEWLNPQTADIMPTKNTYNLDQFKKTEEYLANTRNWLESHVNNVNPVFKSEGTDKILHDQMKIKSLMWFSFAFEDEKYYLLVFNFVRQLHEWQDAEISFVEALARHVELGLMKIRLLDEQMRVTSEVRQLASVVEQATESIVLTDIKGHIKYVNPAFEGITGYTADEALGKNLRILKSGKQQTVFYKELWETIQQGRTWDGRFINRRKDGTEYYEEAVIFPVKNSAGQIVNYCKIGRDITREMELEQQLQQAQKMEAVGTLAGGVAHDFNNLLTVINGYAELALMRLGSDDSSYQAIKAIKNAGKRAEQLTSQLLAFSRKQILKPEIIDVNQIVLSMEKMLRRLINEDIRMETDLSENLPLIKADPVQIEQILTNLVINARDAVQAVTKPEFKKKIIIETGYTFLDEEYISRYPDSQTGYYIFFSVCDNGIGMDEQTKQRIFEPFFTTKAKHKGTGLGLAMVYGIVKQNKGNVYVYSEPGKGTTFKIYWPITDETAKTLEKVVEQKNLSGTETILIVEDDEEVRKLGALLLSSLDYKVYQASNGQTALELIESESLSIDLLITDLIMPEMNGKELADRISVMFPHVKTIYVSGYTDSYIVNNGLLEKGVNFVSKPYSVKNLVAKVRQVLDHN